MITHAQLDGGSGRRFFSDDAFWTSAKAGWSSLHLRHYDHVQNVEQCDLPPSADQVIVLVTRGATLIESFHKGRWHSWAHRLGSLGFTAPGQAARLRWRGERSHATMHLHLPATTMTAALAELRNETSARVGCPGHFAGDDQVVEATLKALARGADDGLPELYAASAAHFLARHLLTRHGSTEARPKVGGETARMQRIEDFMAAQMAEPITLDQLAAIAGCGPFRLIRLCRTFWGETPFQRLTSLRMREAARRLRESDASVLTIALECGYSNPSHFATAFRRHTGLTPSTFRLRAEP